MVFCHQKFHFYENHTIFSTVFHQKSYWFRRKWRFYPIMFNFRTKITYLKTVSFWMKKAHLKWKLPKTYHWSYKKFQNMHIRSKIICIRKHFFVFSTKLDVFIVKGTTWFYRVYNSSLRGSFPKFANPIWNGFRTHHKLRFINCQTD